MSAMSQVVLDPCICGIKIHHTDAVAAYLNSNLTEEMFLQPPDGVPPKARSVWLLKKALYGLKQAGLEWYHTL